MKRLKLFFACLLMAVLSIGQVWGANPVVFTFNSDAGLAALGITKPTSGGTTLDDGTYTLTPVSMSATDGGTPTRVWYSSGNTSLRVYKNNSGANGTLTFTCASNMTQIVFSTSITATPSTGTLSGATWTGSATSVTFEFTANATINTISVTYASSCEKKVTISKGTPSHGDFTLSKDGAQATCDAAVTVVVDPTPAEHYKVTGVTAPNSSSISTPDEDGKYTVTYAQNTNAASEINVNFTLKDQHTVTWNNHGITSTSQVYDGEKPVFPTPNPTSCDATSTTFIGWATTAWDGKLANTDGKTVYTSASAMPDVMGAVTYYAVYAKATAGTPVQHDGPSWDRASNTVHYTDGYTFSASASAPSNKNYYQDASSGTGNIKLYHNTTAIFASTPNTVLLTASIGGGTGGKDLADAVYARLLDKDGNAIGHPTAITSHITTATGDDYEEVELDLTDITSAYGVMLYHEKESGYNVRFYSFSLSYTTGGSTYSDYMTTCAAAGTCEAPSFTPAAGTFNGAQDIELQTSTPSAHIYYTLDGSDPDDGSDEYTTAIHITQNTKIKAITYADGLNESTISEGDFNIRYAQPTFSVASGDYDEAQNVTITATGADAIYYTTNGEDPIVDPANLYDGSAIAINTTGSHTIKAIAVKAGYANSNVASATYVMDLPYATIADFIASGTGSTVKRLQLTNAYILGVNGYSIYVQDASAKGIIIYNKYGYGSAEWVANLVAGNQITGVVSGTNTLYNQQPELASAAFVTPTITAGTRPTPANITAINEAAFTENTMKLVKVSGVYYQESPSNKNYTFTADEDGLATAQKVYDQFGMIADHTMVEVGDQCDLIGIMVRYNANYQLLPVLVTDIAADADAAAPVFTPEGGATEGEALQVDLNSYVTIAAADAKHSVDVDQVQITSTDPVSVTAVSSRDFYRNTSVTKWYYGNASTASYNITIEGVTTQGTVVAQVGDVDAISAKENDEVHVLITPNTHFELATIKVNGNDPTEVITGTEYKFTMPDEAVTIVVTWNEDAKATLTFAKGEATGTEDAPTAITDYVGETVQLPANPFTYSGHKFIGWSCDGGATKLAAGTDYELAENKAFVAYWAAIPTFNDADHEWRLATSLEAGKYYVIGSASQDKTASKTISGGYMGELDTEIEDGVIAYDALNANTAIFLLGGNSTDGWTLTEVTTDNVLGTTANKNVSWNAGTQVWAISIAEGGNATIGGSSRILHNAANTGKRFTTYTSDLTASMLLPQLYVWTEKAFKLRYDANGGTNAPTATPAAAGKATVTDEQPTAPTGKIFDGWNENELGTGENYAAGDEVAVTTTDVTIYAKWRDPYTYTISYNANGGTLMEGKSVIAPEDVTEGEEYSVKANVYEKEGKIFTGWQYGANIYNANDELLPTEDIEFIAQWSDPNITDYVLVTNINQLKNGDKVYIVAASTGNAMGAQYSTTYRQRVEIEKTADKSHVITTGTEPVELTLGTTDGSYYTFNDGTGYLYANSTSANNIGTQEDLTDAGKWTITIDAEGNTTIVSQGETHYNKLTYNAAQPRFAAYKNAQQAVVLYKKLETIREDGVAPGVWGTICPKNEIVNAEGASFFQISYVEYHSGVPYKVFYDEIAEGENLVAGQPYLFLADENATAIKGFKVGNDATSATNDHGFIGVLSDKLITVEAADVTAYRYYIVYDNEIRLCGEGQFRIKAERAYLDMSDPNVEKQNKAPIAGRRRVALTNNAVQNATGCENINASETPVKMIIDGQLYILRGEKMYDATGKLVK